MPTALPDTDPKPRLALRVAVFAGLVLLWGSTWLAIKVGIRHYPPLFSVAVRFCIAGPLLLLGLRLLGRPLPLGRRDQPFFLTIALLSFVTSFSVVYWAEQYITSGLAAVLFATMPLMTGLVSLVLLRTERLGPRWLIGIVLGLAGIAVIHSGDLHQVHPKAPLAALVILVSPFVTAVATVLTKRRSRDFHPFALAGMPMTYGGFIVLGLSLLLERPRDLEWAWPGVASIAYLTVFGSILTFSGYNWLLRHEEVGRLNLLAYLTPICALALGTLAADEPLTLQIVVGGSLAISGVAVAGARGWGTRPRAAPGPPARPRR